MRDAADVSTAPLVRRILLAKGARAFGDGFVSVLLPLYLLELGYRPLQVGIIATATLLGSGVLTLAVGLRAHRFAYRTLLLAATALMAATGIGFAAAFPCGRVSSGFVFGRSFPKPCEPWSALKAPTTGWEAASTTASVRTVSSWPTGGAVPA